jgi:hypothetical protein
MKYTRIPPSDAKVLTDNESGLKFSQRDVSTISSAVNGCSSLIKFGEEVFNKYKDSGKLFMNYDSATKGKGYIVYDIGEEIFVCDVFSNCISEKENVICFEALTESVYNICKSVNKNLVIDIDNKLFNRFILNSNQLFKEQKFEDKYFWKIE